jgi:shikimate dehydrogenase
MAFLLMTTTDSQKTENSSPLHLGLVGYPLNKSLSPIIHETLLKLCNLKGVFNLIPIEPTQFQQTDGFSEVVATHPALAGFNVTIPYKVNAYNWVSQRTPQANRIQAVNTVKRLKDGTYIGHNTDGIGFYTALPETVKHSLNQRNALVLGAGGACRAVLEALFFAKPAVAKITLVVRNVEKAQPIIGLATQWAKQVGSAFEVSTFEAVTPSLLASTQLIINTTPVGMIPDVEASPLSLAQLAAVPPTCFVSDLIYKPAETLLLSYAKHFNLHNQNGLGMLINQGIEAFSFWTNQPTQPHWYSVIETNILSSIN